METAVFGCLKTNGDNWCRNHLANQRLCHLLEQIDVDLAEAVRRQGCVHCAGKLHRGDYKRKPRGGPQWDKRFSFNCSVEGCRCRHTPPSVRFMGRKVYAGFIVVLISAMMHGLKPERMRRLREQLTIDARTLKRWREWWLGRFARSTFWKTARARFMPPLDERELPWSLARRFGVWGRDRLVNLLRFLAPMTTPEAWKQLVM